MGWTVRGSSTGGGEIFRTRPDRPWGPSNLLYNGHRVFPGGKAAGAWRWPPTPSSAEVKEKVEVYLYSPSGPSWPVLGRTFYFNSHVALPSRNTATIDSDWLLSTVMGNYRILSIIIEKTVAGCQSITHSKLQYKVNYSFRIGDSTLQLRSWHSCCTFGWSRVHSSRHMPSIAPVSLSWYPVSKGKCWVAAWNQAMTISLHTLPNSLYTNPLTCIHCERC
jgi:hypothetical protein